VTLAVGIDVGGTKVAAGLVDVARGEVVRSERLPTRPERGGPAVLADCVELAARLGGDGIPVGLGICEVVGRDGQLATAETVEWRDLDVVGAFGGAAVTVESDVRAAALAEARFGAGAGLRSFLHVVVGTGAATCLVLDGRPHLGEHGNAIILGAPPVEQVAGGATLGERVQDPEVRAGAAAAVGRVVAVLVNALDPAAVVVGGGLGASPGFSDGMAAALRPAIWCEATRGLPVLPTALGESGGVLGAALAAVEARG
jgi:glucokinase